MSQGSTDASTDTRRTAGSWAQLAESVLQGHELSRDEAMTILQAPDEQLIELLAAAYQVRHRYFGNRVLLHFLMNAKSGLCPEDCTYCSQSKVSAAEIPKYNLLAPEKVLKGARMAAENDARTYCIVISARGPSEREMDAVTRLVPKIKAAHDLKICACLGLLTSHEAERLKACGVDRINHNLNTGENFYGDICTTHTYQDRLETLGAAADAGLELCTGGIIGMGERPADVVDMALDLRRLKAHSIPVNFLIPIAGTPLEDRDELNPRYCLKVLSMFRLTNPKSELRIAGGRELHLRSLQPLGLYAANSIFIGDYLTTKGQPPKDDFRMLQDMGFEVTREGRANCDTAAS